MESKEAIKVMLAERGVGTAIIFIELVHGCDQHLCPSWGKVCHYTDELNFMSEETLNNILGEISDCYDLLEGFDKVDIWPYGCGDPTRHPHLSQMLHKIHSVIPYPMALSIDSNSFIHYGDWAEFTRLKVMHKLPKDGWLENANKWNDEFGGRVQHGIIANTITHKLWEDVKNSGGEGISKGRTFLTIPFGSSQMPDDVPDYQRVTFEIDSSIPKTSHLYQGALAKRTMFSWDGSLRRCLVAGTNAKSFRELLSEPIDRCAKCFEKTGGQLINFYKDHVEIEEFACCVSDRPL